MLIKCHLSVMIPDQHVDFSEVMPTFCMFPARCLGLCAAATANDSLPLCQLPTHVQHCPSIKSASKARDAYLPRCPNLVFVCYFKSWLSSRDSPAPFYRTISGWL